MDQSGDAAIDAIAALHDTGQELSFAWLRQTFGDQKSEETYRSLRYGRAIIDSEDQLNQYLYSYGPMIESQWEVASNYISGQSIKLGARLIDYGCGQGLAGLFIRERIGEEPFRRLGSVVLIEPSRPALMRAAAMYRLMCPDSEISLVQKRFDELLEADIAVKGATASVHIFSNVLDIPGYNHLDLLGKGLSRGQHTILAVGHDRDYSGGSRYIEKLKAAVEDPSMAPQISVSLSTLERFKCSNRGEPAIVWYCELDVKNG